MRELVFLIALLIFIKPIIYIIEFIASHWNVFVYTFIFIIFMGFIYFKNPIRLLKNKKKKVEYYTNYRKNPIPSRSPSMRAENRISVPSMTEDDSYSIDPQNATCTCPDWKKRRSESAHSDLPSRLCKHLVAYYSAHPEQIPSHLRAYTDNIRSLSEAGRGMPGQKAIYAEKDGISVVLDYYSVNINGWVNIRIGDESYGYNIQEKRWSYNNKPQDAKEYERYIKENMKYFK